MAQTFKDQALQEEFERRGYVVVRLLSTEAASELRKQVDDIRSVHSGESCSIDIDQSFCNTDAAYRLKMEQLCGDAVKHALLDLMPTYRLLGTGVMIKKAGSGPMDIHRDRTLLEDLNSAPVAAWCPLVDVNDSYGNLSMLPGSQKLGNVETKGLPRFYAPLWQQTEKALRRPAATGRRGNSIRLQAAALGESQSAR